MTLSFPSPVTITCNAGSPQVAGKPPAQWHHADEVRLLRAQHHRAMGAALAPTELLAAIASERTGASEAQPTARKIAARRPCRAGIDTSCRPGTSDDNSRLTHDEAKIHAAHSAMSRADASGPRATISQARSLKLQALSRELRASRAGARPNPGFLVSESLRLLLYFRNSTAARARDSIGTPPCARRSVRSPAPASVPGARAAANPGGAPFRI